MEDSRNTFKTLTGSTKRKRALGGTRAVLNVFQRNTCYCEELDGFNPIYLRRTFINAHCISGTVSQELAIYLLLSNFF